MDSAATDACSPLTDGTALAVARGTLRLFFRHDMSGILEVPLPNGRRADIMAIDSAGRLTIVEIKCSRADLLGDRPGGRNGDDIGMHRAALVNRIEIQRRGVHAVHERGASTTDALAARPQGAIQRLDRQQRITHSCASKGHFSC